MRAAVLESPRTIALRTVEPLAPAPDEILIRTEYAGVCGSDLHAFNGRHPFRKPPVILGHELAGTVARLGAEVRGFRKGDRVTVMPLVACGACQPCRAGRENLCLNKRVPGVGGWLGAFAEYALAKASVTFRVRDTTPLEVAALAEPLAVGIHSVFRQARLPAASRVLVLGAGPIGLLTAMAARAAGAVEVAVTDLLDFNLTVAREICGAVAYNVSREAWETDALRAHPDKFDVAFLCSGGPATVRQAVNLTRRGGRIIVTGMFLEPVPLELTAISLNELELIGSVVYDQADFGRALQWIDEGRFDFRRLITHILPLQKAQEALTLLANRREDAIKILLAANG